MRKLNTLVLLAIAVLLQFQSEAQRADKQWVKLASAPQEQNTSTISHHLFGTLEWTNSQVLNSSRKDFSPVFYDRGIVFPSTRKAKRKSAASGYRYLYARVNGEGQVRTARNFDAGTKKYLVQGPVCFSPSGKTLFFATPNGKNSDKQTVHHLSFIQKTKRGWAKQKALPLNVAGYSSTHPFLANDGTVLYFSSNQPGGYGGMDLYKSIYNDGVWSEPINLGPSINTAADEVYPMLAEDKQLYFASSQAGGMGGLDLYVATEKADEWQQVQNMGAPFNSSYDDFGFLLHKNLLGGYFSSNRPGGQGDVDIYSWNITQGIAAQELARVNVKPKAETQVQEVMDMISNEAFMDRISQELAIQEEKVPSTDPQSAGQPAIATVDYLAQAVESEQATVEENIIHNSRVGLSANEKRETFATSEAQFIAQLLKEYPGLSVKLHPNEVDADLTKVRSMLIDEGVADTRIRTAVHKDELARIANGKVLDAEADAMATNEVFEADAAEEASASEESAYALAHYESIMSERLKMGKGAKLTKVHYGYNQHQLDDDSMAEIDNIIALMKQYQSLQIGLVGHTDSFGGNAYNLKLSQKRAAFVKAYMVARGINPSRLQVRAKGESDLIVDCHYEQNCTRYRQSINRRTELVILNVNESEISGL